MNASAPSPSTSLPDQEGPTTAPSLVQVDDLVVHYSVKGSGTFIRPRETVHAVDGVSFEIAERQTLGLVGESGCGKSTTGRAVLLLEQPASGRVVFRGRDITAVDPRKQNDLRQDMQMVFQDPVGSLNPRHTVGQLVGEPLQVHHLARRSQQRARVEEILSLVGLPRDVIGRFPHEFSGGQCQRIGIARAIAAEPKFLVLDEPVSALDVSIQAQILRLLDDLQTELGLTYLFIAHDLAVVGEMSDRVAVMYLGKIVEIADRNLLYAAPRHPYTQALFSAVPIADPVLSRAQDRRVITGEVPSALHPPAGCRFRTRCPLATDVCQQEEPALRSIQSGHLVACHHAEQAAIEKPFGTATMQD